MPTVEDIFIITLKMNEKLGYHHSCSLAGSYLLFYTTMNCVVTPTPLLPLLSIPPEHGCLSVSFGAVLAQVIFHRESGPERQPSNATEWNGCASSVTPTHTNTHTHCKGSTSNTVEPP